MEEGSFLKAVQRNVCRKGLKRQGSDPNKYLGICMHHYVEGIAGIVPSLSGKGYKAFDDDFADSVS